jgi:hypothetical protein
MRAFTFAAALLVPTAIHGDQILRTFEGSDAHTTRPFEVTGPWEIQWDAHGSLFQIFLFGEDGNFIGVPANGSGGTGSAYQPRGGRFYLQMNATGAWEVRIVAVE